MLHKGGPQGSLHSLEVDPAYAAFPSPLQALISSAGIYLPNSLQVWEQKLHVRKMFSRYTFSMVAAQWWTRFLLCLINSISCLQGGYLKWNSLIELVYTAFLLLKGHSTYASPLWPLAIPSVLFAILVKWHTRSSRENYWAPQKRARAGLKWDLM